MCYSFPGCIYTFCLAFLNRYTSRKRVTERNGFLKLHTALKWLYLYVYYSGCFVSMRGLNLHHFIQPMLSYFEIIVFSKMTLMQSNIYRP